MSPPKRAGRLILGLMSGTSHDGVEAALVLFSRSAPRLLRHTHSPYPAGLGSAVSAAMGPSGSAEAVCDLNFRLGEFFARAALKCMAGYGVGPGEMWAIASHGQTLWHSPPVRRRPGSTLQIGEPAVIAARTGVRVVSDFRQADMAMGGQGAPLVPLADYLLFKNKATCAVHNLGGISNTTVVTPRREDVVAFDTGPGMGLMDEASRRLLNKPFDRGGRAARRGRPNKKLLGNLLKHPFYNRKPPKSTGMEEFGPAYLISILRARRSMRPDDLLSTLAYLTAHTVRMAYSRFVSPGHDIKEVILSGGGAKNVFLVELIREMMSPVPVVMVDECGIPAGAKEAMSFAILANETLRGRPGNLPRATGASGPVVLGRITPAPHGR